MNYKVGCSFYLQEIPSSYNILSTQFQTEFLERPICRYLLMQIWWSRWWTCVMGKRVKSNYIENKHTLFIISAFYTSPTGKVAPNLHTIILYVSLSLLTWDSSSIIYIFQMNIPFCLILTSRVSTDFRFQSIKHFLSIYYSMCQSLYWEHKDES